MRKTHEELQEVKKKHKIDKLWSFSKINTYRTSPFEYWLKYIAKVEEDRGDSAYAVYGSAVHDIMERYYSKQITYEQIATELEEILFTLDLTNLKFDRSDEEKNEKIKKKYIENLKHFAKNHVPIKRKVALEQFVTVKVGTHIFQGYLDITYKDEQGNYHVIDLKTSTVYKGAKIKKESSQLILYSLALMQTGIPIEKIRAGWNFVKYICCQVEQGNGKQVERQIERASLGKELKANCSMWLKKLGYADEVADYTDLLHQTNDIGCLPEEVQAKYKFSDCYVYIELNEDVVQQLQNDFIDIIAEIESKEAEYLKTKDESIFYDSDESVVAESYYFANLCGYSPEKHIPYKKYLEAYNAKKENNMFDGIGAEISEDEMAWLNAI